MQSAVVDSPQGDRLHQIHQDAEKTNENDDGREKPVDHAYQSPRG